MILNKNEVDTIAIGGFDGIHRGHLQLINRLGKHGALAVVEKEGANLTPGLKRCQYSKYPCMFYHFLKIKDLSAKEFIALLQKDFPQLKRIVVGYDFMFGKNRSHQAKDIQGLFKGEVEIVSEYSYDNISVHSKFIREQLQNGNIFTANRLLGREYSLIGDIIKGQGIGSKSLYPTLNLRTHNYLLPANGVYATRTTIKESVYDSVSFIGIRESVDQNFSVETHIIGKDNLEPIKWVELFFVEQLRQNQKFASLKQLKDQISKDIKRAKGILTSCSYYLNDPLTRPHNG